MTELGRPPSYAAGKIDLEGIFSANATKVQEKKALLVALKKLNLGNSSRTFAVALDEDITITNYVLLKNKCFIGAFFRYHKEEGKKVSLEDSDLEELDQE